MTVQDAARDIADALPAIASALGDRSRCASILTSHAALDRRPVSSERLLRAWLADGTAGVDGGAFLDRLLLDPSKTGQDSVLIEALSAKDSGIREATIDQNAPDYAMRTLPTLCDTCPATLSDGRPPSTSAGFTPTRSMALMPVIMTVG